MKPEIFVLGQENKYVYAGFCKITVNVLSNLLSIKPVDEIYEMISAGFDWQYIQKENRLFVFGPHESQAFVLILKSSVSCSKILGIIVNKKESSAKVDKNSLQKTFEKRFFLPAFEQLQLDDNEDMKLKELIYEMIDLFEGEEERKYQIMLGEKNASTKSNSDKNISPSSTFYCGNSRQSLNTRKRKFGAIDKSNVENSNENSQFLKKNSGDNEFISLKTSMPANVAKFDVIKKPNYELKQILFNKRRLKRLIIFKSDNKKMCYEFTRYSTTKWACYKLNQYTIKANICINDSGEEYVNLEQKRHICEPQIYDEDRYFNESQIVNLPNFELQEKTANGYQTLIVIDTYDRNLCYKYKFSEHYGFFCCTKCQRKHVYAKLFYNDKNDPYVVLGHQNHICHLQPYNPEAKNLILESTRFTFIPKTAKRNSRLIIYSSEEKNYGYEFVQRENKLYYCMGCRRKKGVETLSAKLLERENGEKYVQLKKELVHECQLKEFGPNLKDQYKEKLVHFPDFIIYCQKDEPEKHRLLIYNCDNRNLCYDYFWYPWEKGFACRECKKISRKTKNGIVAARLFTDENGKQYLRLQNKSHFCEPLKVDSVITSKTKVVENVRELANTENPYDKNKVVIKEGGFVLRQNKLGVPDAELIVFKCPEERSQCYLYNFASAAGQYNYLACQRKKNKSVTAKIKNDENGKKCLVLSKAEHVCEPIKYEDLKENRHYNFIIFNRDSSVKHKILIVFISTDQKECYRYGFCNRNKLFICCGCQRGEEKKYVSAKIAFDENGKEYILFGPNPHLCTPEEYKPEKFEDKEKIPSTEFELLPNTNGVQNNKLIIFTQSNQNFAYEYIANRITKRYYCCSCNSQKKYVFLELFNEKNESYVELDNTEHICIQRNLIEWNRMFYEFKIKECPKGIKNVTVTDQAKQQITYIFALDAKLQLYYCIKCKEKNRFITYKIHKIDENSEALVLNGTHTCRCHIKK